MKKMFRRFISRGKTLILSSIIGDLYVKLNYTKLKHVKVRGMHGGIMINLEEAIEEAIDQFCPTERENLKLKEDIAICKWKYKGITPEEYFIFGFRENGHKYRKEFVSRYEKDQMYIRSIGLGENYELLHDKYKFYNNFKEFYKRDVCKLTRDDLGEFKTFCNKHTKYIAKSATGAGGFGTVIRSHNGTNLGIQAEIDFLLANGSKWVVEELIEQNETMALWNESSINTIRVTSYHNSKGFGIMDTVIRIGREGSSVDNASSGGVTAYVDKETGIILTDAVDKNNYVYSKHPDSNIQFVGFQVPQWEELKALVEIIHKRINFYPCVGWDFALSTDGWVLIEGNWGNLISQYILKKGLRKDFYNCFK